MTGCRVVLFNNNKGKRIQRYISKNVDGFLRGYKTTLEETEEDNCIIFCATPNSARLLIIQPTEM
jgi:hypothetical protein